MATRTVHAVTANNALVLQALERTFHGKELCAIETLVAVDVRFNLKNLRSNFHCERVPAFGFIPTDRIEAGTLHDPHSSAHFKRYP